MATLQITLTRSLIGRPEDQRDTCRALGLTKTNSTVRQADTPVIRGMLKKVSHLVKVVSLEVQA
ncbi:MAG: 50S ribosomal protein L30 [Firmicutes bacterium]|nr:50S ribosomal protein L30 [Dethiobacter sp.]MBS3888269.1 50S ribosomal protein L30 [Bacillota bacterium]MBS4053637.1 50S ribosomal protein L30 [Thermaerobacter sp.]